MKLNLLLGLYSGAMAAYAIGKKNSGSEVSKDWLAAKPLVALGNVTNSTKDAISTTEALLRGAAIVGAIAAVAQK